MGERASAKFHPCIKVMPARPYSDHWRMSVEFGWIWAQFSWNLAYGELVDGQIDGWTGRCWMHGQHETNMEDIINFALKNT